MVTVDEDASSFVREDDVGKRARRDKFLHKDSSSIDATFFVSNFSVCLSLLGFRFSFAVSSMIFGFLGISIVAKGET